MLCKWPGRHFACGKCLPCKINKQRIWTMRLMLEAQFDPNPLFATFTYETEPHGRILQKTHLSSAIHRARDYVRGEPSKGAGTGSSPLRFFGIGEYGTRTGRPHYHAAVFGLPEGLQELSTPSRPRPSGLLTQCWYGSESHAGKARVFNDGSGAVAGKVDVRRLDPGLAQYITGYLGKGLTVDDEYTRKKLQGRPPEFAVMSRRPGIGAVAIESITDALTTAAGAAFIAKTGDVPYAFAAGGKQLPLGRYLRGWLRLNLFGDHRQPAVARELADERVRHEKAQYMPGMLQDPRLFERFPAYPVSDEVFQLVTAAQNAWSSERESRRQVKAVQAEVRNKIKSSKGSL